jgi:hypothetical protein
MEQLILDLSGRAGLSDGFFGDSDMITPQPSLRLANQPSDIVSGLFNPYLRNGYLSPTTTTTTAVTLDTAAGTQLSSVEYDYINNHVLWADGANKIYKGTSLVDTSLSLEATLDFGIPIPIKYYGLHDLQIYQLNGKPKLFYSGVGSSQNIVGGNEYPEVAIGTIPTTDDWAVACASVIPSGSTQPAVVYSNRDFQSSGSSTHTVSVTIPSGTNLALTVIEFWTTGTSLTTSGVTYNGVAMSILTGTSSTTNGSSVYSLANPPVGTFNVVTSFNGSVTNRLMYVIVTDNTNQVSNYTSFANSEANETSLNVFTRKRIVAPNQITLIAAFSDQVITSTMTGVTSLYNTTNAYGSDLLAYETDSGLYLQTGVADLPLDSASISEAAWLTETATGGVLEIVKSDAFAILRTADNGFMYLMADNIVHKIDGTITGGANGTVTRNVLLFPDYFRITDAIDYRSRLYIATHQYPVDVSDSTTSLFTGRCGIFVWNRISTQLSSSDYIELPGVREIKKIFASPDGQLRLITISDSGLTELREFGYNDSGGVVFPVKKTLGIGAYPQFPDGLATAGDKVVWLANDGKMYCNKGESVTQIFQAKAPGVTTATLESNIASGAVFYGSSDETASNGYRSNKQAVTLAYLNGATHTIVRIYPFDLTTGSNGAQTPNQGDVYTGVQLIPIGSNVRTLRIYNAPITGSGTDVIATVKLYFNQGTTATHPSGMTKSITKNEAKRGYVDFAINSQNVHAVQIEVEWATGTAIGADMYLPSTAILQYEPTSAQGPDSD